MVHHTLKRLYACLGHSKAAVVMIDHHIMISHYDVGSACPSADQKSGRPDSLLILGPFDTERKGNTLSVKAQWKGEGAYIEASSNIPGYMRIFRSPFKLKQVRCQGIQRSIGKQCLPILWIHDALE